MRGPWPVLGLVVLLSAAAFGATTFFDRVHQPLHELAAEVAASDRAAAARLLEAKEAVEHDLAGEPSVLRAGWTGLVEATRRATRGAALRMRWRICTWPR